MKTIGVLNSVFGLFFAISVGAVLCRISDAQTIRTANGTLVFEVGGASFTLAPNVFSAGTPSNNADSQFVFQTDLQAAIGNLGNLLQSQINYSNTRIDGVANTQSSLSMSVGFLSANINAQLSSSFASLGAMLGAQLFASQSFSSTQITALQNNMTSLHNQDLLQITLEMSRAVGVENSLSNSVQSTTSQLSLMVSSLAANLTNEVARAVSVDASLAVSISALANNLQANSSALAASVLSSSTTIQALQASTGALAQSTAAVANTFLANSSALAMSTAVLASVLQASNSALIAAMQSTNAAFSTSIEALQANNSALAASLQLLQANNSALTTTIQTLSTRSSSLGPSVVIFTTIGVSNWTCPSNVFTVEILIVAGNPLDLA